jgi:hypothetical protein
LATGRKPGEPDKKRSADADLARSFGLGCLILLGLFLAGWVVIFLFWMN